jgi:ABC-type Fe3+-hydroxamate transport system substrate-binding protein
MRIVSLVPSWTETLLEAGIEVVGRTRFCIHGPGVEKIPKIGGTKDWDFPRIKALKPDLLLLDREENPKFMGEQNEIPFYATHVTGLADMPKCLREMGGILKNSELAKMAGEWEKILSAKPAAGPLPGLIEEPTGPYTQAVYLIWKDPWMAAGPGTFISSVLEFFGVKLLMLDGKYPKVDLAAFPKDTLLIFSSEPYPFLKKREGLAQLGFPVAFADGEKFSWFGVRAQRFLTSSCATR